MIIIVENRGAKLANSKPLRQRLAKLFINYEEREIEECQDIIVLDFPFSKKVGSDKLAFDWIVKGRGFKNFSLVPTKAGSLELAKFSRGECRKAFFSCMKKNDNVKEIKRLDVYSTSVIKRR